MLWEGTTQDIAWGLKVASIQANTHKVPICLLISMTEKAHLHFIFLAFILLYFILFKFVEGKAQDVNIYRPPGLEIVIFLPEAP